MSGEREDTRAVRQGRQEFEGFLSSLLSSPQQARSFFGVEGLGDARSELQALLAGGGQAAGQRVINAALPGFDQSLRFAQGALSAQASSPFSTAFGLQSTDLASRAVRDFNLFQAQQLASGQERAIRAAQILGSLAQTEAGALGGLLNTGGSFFNLGQDPQQSGFFESLLNNAIRAGGVAGGAALSG